MLAVQSCAYGSEDGVLTADMLKKVRFNSFKRHRVSGLVKISIRTPLAVLPV